MSIHRFKYLFHQFINKTATSEEAGEFLAMMKKENYNDELQILLDEFWNDPGSITPLGEERANKIFNQIMTSAAVTEPKRLFSYKRSWLRAAAAILIISLSAMLYKLNLRPQDTSLAEVKKSKVEKLIKPARRFINLPDGSSVILNENSNLVIGNQFNTNGKREVYLEGEAYFDIAHNPSQPFIVHTGELQTTVLGTAFNIKTNSGTQTVTVTVTRGKVKVGDNQNIYNVLLPDEQIIVDQKRNNHVKRPVKAEKVIAWKNEDLYFDDVSIKHVAKELQERFHITIIFSNEQMKTCRFSATFLKSQSLEQILNVIGEFNNLKYEFKDNDTVVLDGAGCH